MDISVQVHWDGKIIIKINAFHFYNGFYKFLFQAVSWATVFGISNSAQIYEYMNDYMYSALLIVFSSINTFTSVQL